MIQQGERNRREKIKVGKGFERNENLALIRCLKTYILTFALLHKNYVLNKIPNYTTAATSTSSKLLLNRINRILHTQFNYTFLLYQLKSLYSP